MHKTKVTEWHNEMKQTEKESVGGNTYATPPLQIVRVIISMTIKIGDTNLDNILMHEKWCENILVYNILYKTLIVNPLRITFCKIDWFIRVYDRTRYLVLFGSEKYDFIYNKIRYLITKYLIRVKSGITYIISHNYAKITVDAYDFLTLEKNDFSQCYNTY